MSVRIRKVLVANRGEIARRVLRTVPRDGHRERRGLLRTPTTRAARRRRRRGGPHRAGRRAASRISRSTAMLAAARRDRRRRDPSRLRLPVGERRLRRARRRGRAHLHRPAGRGDPAHGQQDRREGRSWRRRGVPVVPGVARRAAARRERRRAARTLGFPVLIKASAGGGGKGMRIVRDARRAHRGARDARAARRAARSATTRCCSSATSMRPRHIEIQIFGDAHGNVDPPRRARVLDPAPLPEGDRGGAVAGRRRRAARRAWARRRSRPRGRSATSAPARSSSSSISRASFYFLEVNTRLQVEHPVTEAVTGLDLVRWQILLARRRARCRCGRPTSPRRARDRGPPLRRGSRQRLPAGDRIAGAVEPATIAGIRYDGGVERGSEVGVHYDPLLARDHRARPTRHEAIAVGSRRALELLGVGPITTNRDFLIAVLDHPAFAAGELTPISSSSICRAADRTAARRPEHATASTRSSPRSTSTSAAARRLDRCRRASRRVGATIAGGAQDASFTVGGRAHRRPLRRRADGRVRDHGSATRRSPVACSTPTRPASASRSTACAGAFSVIATDGALGRARSARDRHADARAAVPARRARGPGGRLPGAR